MYQDCFAVKFNESDRMLMFETRKILFRLSGQFSLAMGHKNASIYLFTIDTFLRFTTQLSEILHWK